MRNNTCSNCHVQVYRSDWVRRWCNDCVRAGLKASAVTAGPAIVAAIWAWLSR